MGTTDTRQALLRVGIDLIGLQGFNATGLDAVLKAADVPKGSFYHHFKSKEAFALAVIDDFCERLVQGLMACLEQPGEPPLERLRLFFTERRDLFVANDCARGCLLGNLGQELAGQHPRIRARLLEALEAWRGRVAACLREAQDRGELRRELEADRLAGFILSGFQGALLRAKVARSPEPFQEFMDTLFATVLLP